MIFSSLAPKWIFCPAWLCGWAIGLTTMAPGGFSAVETLPLQIAAAMLVGVWYVGVFLNIVRNRMLAFLAKRQKP